MLKLGLRGPRVKKGWEPLAYTNKKTHIISSCQRIMSSCYTLCHILRYQFMNHLQLNQIWSVVTIFRMTWHQTAHCLLLSKSKNCNYNPNQVRPNKVHISDWFSTKRKSVCCQLNRKQEEYFKGPKIGDKRDISRDIKSE